MSSFEILLKLKNKFLHLLQKKLFSPYVMCMQCMEVLIALGDIISALGVS